MKDHGHFVNGRPRGGVHHAGNRAQPAIESDGANVGSHHVQSQPRYAPVTQRPNDLAHEQGANAAAAILRQDVKRLQGSSGSTLPCASPTTFEPSTAAVKNESSRPTSSIKARRIRTVPAPTCPPSTRARSAIRWPRTQRRHSRRRCQHRPRSLHPREPVIAPRDTACRVLPSTRTA